jgi:broad specificity phosphatase PhoE
MGGSLGRREATGRGVMIVTREAAKHLKLDINGATVAVQGFGNVGSVSADLLARIGAKIVAVTDWKGGVYNPKGLNPAALLRHLKTGADTVVGYPGTDAITNDELIELDVGEWTGMDLKEAMKRPEWSTIQRYPSGFTFPGGESFATMQARMVAALARLRARHPGESVVAVSHADPIRAVVAHAMGTHLDLFQRVVVSPCSLTALALGDAGPTVLTVNATGDQAMVPA